MPSLEPKLVWLAAIHVVAGISAAWLVMRGVAPAATQTFSDALLGAEIGLLGIWTGLGEHSKLTGFAGVGAGAAYFTTLATAEVWPPVFPATRYDLYFMLWYPMSVLALALMALTGIVAASAVLRRRGMRLRRGLIGTETPAGKDVQFSIRQLMLLVFVVAVLVRLGPTVQLNNDFSVAMLLAVTCWGACFAAVGLAGLWAALDGCLSAAKVFIAIALANGLSLLPPYYSPVADDFAHSAAVLVGALLIEIGSLLVVRSCGYRLAVDEAGAAVKIAAPGALG